jgi:hypothetical protein
VEVGQEVVVIDSAPPEPPPELPEDELPLEEEEVLPLLDDELLPLLEDEELLLDDEAPSPPELEAPATASLLLLLPPHADSAKRDADTRKKRTDFDCRTEAVLASKGISRLRQIVASTQTGLLPIYRR